jgi:hypothetical protein
VRCLLVVFVLAAGCVSPDQHDAAKYGTYGVALAAPFKHADPTLDAGPWRPDQVDVIAKCYQTFERLGPLFPIVTEGQARILLRPYNASVDSTDPRQGGRYSPGSPIVECDPARTPGYEALCACVAHETGHFLGMQHICMQADEVPDCSPVGYGVAVMNPSIVYGDTAKNETVSQSTPTGLDLAEFRRVQVDR